MTEHYTLHPRFAVTARTGLSAGTALSFQAGAELGPALLVPVDVQALVVAPGDVVEHADVRARLFDQLPAGTPRRLPDPFSDLMPRSAGVRLHWAMPDGLTQARANDPDAGPRWRPLPDRWVILRLLPGEGNLDRRPVTGWVLESERGRVTGLDSWVPGPPNPADPPPATPRLDPADLNPVRGGDPAWAAVFDNVERRFALHDDWSGLSTAPQGAVAYVVVGWYSRPELDPLADAGTADGFDARLRELGWRVDAARLATTRQQAQDTAAAARGVGLDARTSALLPTAGFGALTPTAAQDTRPWWPRRCLFHGVVYGVRVDSPPPDRRPDRSDVRVALGESAEQALAALLAGTLADPEVEVLQAVFDHNLTDILGEPDGLARVEAELHAAGFDAKPGGTRAERVWAGDPFGEVRPPARTPAMDALRASRPDRSVRSTFIAGGSRVADLHTAENTESRSVPPPPRTLDEIELPASRWFSPRDLSAVVRGLGRSLRHGYDGRFDAEESVSCRLTGDPITRLLGFIDGHELLERGVEHGAVPADAEALLVEAAIEDPFEDFSNLLERFASRFGYSYDDLLRVFRAESRVFRWWLARGGAATPLLGLSLKDGVGPSPVGITIWSQAWVPLYLEWELTIDPDVPVADWPLDELDLEPPPGISLDGTAAPTFRGRSLLNGASARALTDEIRGFLDHEDQLDLGGRGRLPEALEATLRGLGDEAEYADLLTAGLDGLREQLLGFTEDLAQGSRLPSTPPRPLRAGLARLERLRVVDAFGRTLTLVDRARPAPDVSRGLRSDRPELVDTVVLRPRVNQPARLVLRFTDPTQDGREAGVDQAPGTGGTVSPVAGWLVPDHADGALEVFSPDGTALGQLAHDALSGAVIWEGPPGDRAPLGRPPEDAMATDPHLRHLLRMARSLLDRDAAERAILAGGYVRSDTPLEALLRVVETTGATVGLGGHSGTEHLAQLVGRPIAVVRAVLRLEIEPERPFPDLPEADQQARDEAWARLVAQAFWVRLGALTRLDDGLLGFFAGDDYVHLHPVHDSVLTLAVPGGRHQGDFGDRRRGMPAAPRPIVSGYAAGEPLIRIHPGQTVTLTLLQDPATRVHATCGMLPRKSVSLIRDWIDAPLARLVPSVRVGPVLVDPSAIRMPLASTLGSRQEWGRRDGPASWRQDPVAAATQQALLPETPAMAQEGYLRIAPDDEGS